MSNEFYLSRGYTPQVKSVTISGLSTIKVWTPAAGKRVVVTNVSISSNAAGTIAFYFEGNDRIAQFFRQGSATINPHIGSWESTTVAGGIFAKVNTSETDGVYVNLEGFEM